MENLGFERLNMKTETEIPDSQELKKRPAN